MDGGEEGEFRRVFAEPWLRYRQLHIGPQLGVFLVQRDLFVEVRVPRQVVDQIEDEAPTPTPPQLGQVPAMECEVSLNGMAPPL